MRHYVMMVAAPKTACGLPTATTPDVSGGVWAGVDCEECLKGRDPQPMIGPPPQQYLRSLVLDELLPRVVVHSNPEDPESDWVCVLCRRRTPATAVPGPKLAAHSTFCKLREAQIVSG